MHQDRTAGPTEPLLALYQETWAEITRLRETQWKIAYYFVSLSAGLIILLTNDNVRPVLGFSVRIALTLLQVISSVFAVIYLEMSHRYLTQQRNIRRQLEESLGFYDAGVYAPVPILPTEWKGKRITHWFQRMGLIVPLMTIVIAVQALTVYLIWNVKAGSDILSGDSFYD